MTPESQAKFKRFSGGPITSDIQSIKIPGHDSPAPIYVGRAWMEENGIQVGQVSDEDRKLHYSDGGVDVSCEQFQVISDKCCVSTC